MKNTDLKPLLRRQLGFLLETAKFLDETYDGNIPGFVRLRATDLASYSLIPATQFINVINDEPFAMTFYPKIVSAFAVVDNITNFSIDEQWLESREYYEKFVDRLGTEGIALLNTSNVIKAYSEMFILYLNHYHDGGPKYGVPETHIDFAPDDATENAAWYHMYGVNLGVSMSTFSKAVSDFMYDYGVHKTAQAKVTFNHDMIKIDIMHFDMQGRPVYVKPKMPR